MPASPDGFIERTILLYEEHNNGADHLTISRENDLIMIHQYSGRTDVTIQVPTSIFNTFVDQYTNPPMPEKRASEGLPRQTPQARAEYRRRVIPIIYDRIMAARFGITKAVGISPDLGRTLNAIVEALDGLLALEQQED